MSEKMATATEERRTDSERKLWRTAPQPGMTPDEPQRLRDHGTTDAPRHTQEDGVITRVKDRLLRRR
jgi:hypothetical protein